ncbi:hypothetical protein VME0621_04674 [Vibrio mediterranei]|uniref:hypothetical protein n=1 Tax=Vibrio TaxID=662 RepID=UPI0007850CAF|nr:MULTISPECIES: hypothetical protein [Vibrio]MCF4176351.1 hypothetical protein [Vibrio sp. McD22-P3]SBO12520.1 hypothetical protein VME0621_04674 [Vibrio mediterranei]
MSEKRLSPEELQQVGLPEIDMHDDNPTKLTKLFAHYRTSGKPLPSYGVNEDGDVQLNQSLLARLGKIRQGKQVFKRDYAREMLEAAIADCGLEERDTPEAVSDAETVREAMQDNINSVRREMSGVDDKLQEALTKDNFLKANQCTSM